MPKTKVRFRKKEGEVEINWRCLQEKCPQNCCGPFSDHLATYAPLKKIKRDDIIVLKEEFERFQKNNLQNNLVKLNGDHYIKLNKKDRSCPFFKKGQCSCYNLRPALCKAYPFYLDLFTGINIDLSCPGVGKGWTKIKDCHTFLSALGIIYTKHIHDIIWSDFKKYV
jgi:Fe-S-cluster containining protein